VKKRRTLQDDYAIARASQEKRAKRGDVWVLEEVRCLELGDFEAEEVGVSGGKKA